jgi:Cu-Zn family superoxide dismutase
MRAAIIFLASFLIAAANAQTATQVDIKDSSGQSLGVLTLTETSGGVQVSGDLKGLPAGKHGIHIHEKGSCVAPDFKSAGDHFNPTGAQHGQQNPRGPHAGDLGNITVSEQGTVSVNMMAKGATLSSGTASLLKSGGTAVVIHATIDDLKSDPSGNSGDRIACGAIRNR